MESQLIIDGRKGSDGSNCSISHPCLCDARMHPPARVLNNLDKFNQNFVWGLTDEKKKMHMVNWKTITRPKRRGGLGIQEARGRNLNLAAKLCWRMENSKNGG